MFREDPDPVTRFVNDVSTSLELTKENVLAGSLGAEPVQEQVAGR
jgi:hypothetical protein